MILKPLDYIDIVNVQQAGILYMVTMTMDSGNENFLEGCFRGTFDSGFGIVKVKIDNTRDVQLLSTGTEDYFDSAYYFRQLYVVGL